MAFKHYCEATEVIIAGYSMFSVACLPISPYASTDSGSSCFSFVSSIPVAIGSSVCSSFPIICRYVGGSGDYNNAATRTVLLVYQRVNRLCRDDVDMPISSYWQSSLKLCNTAAFKKHIYIYLYCWFCTLKVCKTNTLNSIFFLFHRPTCTNGPPLLHKNDCCVYMIPDQQVLHRTSLYVPNYIAQYVY